MNLDNNIKNKERMGDMSWGHVWYGVAHSQDNRAHAGCNGGRKFSVQAADKEPGRVESHYSPIPV